MVCHAGNIITDSTGSAFGFRYVVQFRRQQVNVSGQICKQKINQFRNFLFFLFGIIIGINTVEHEPVQLVIDILYIRRHFQGIAFGIFNDRHDHCIDTGGSCCTEYGGNFLWNIRNGHDTGTNGIVNVMVHIGNTVSHTDNAAFEGVSLFAGSMAENTVACFIGEIQSPTVFFEDIHYTQTLFIVMKTAGHQIIKGTFSGMAEGGVSEVMRQRNGFG